MKFPPNVWNQIKNKSPNDFIKALKKDGWKKDESKGAVQVFRNPKTNSRVTIHVHPGKIYGPSMVEALIEDIGWSIEDMKRVKFIK
jgi:predicted RNA binding protein YcfA (HicA-like mRNA interferase family)